MLSLQKTFRMASRLRKGGLHIRPRLLSCNVYVAALNPAGFDFQKQI